MPSLCHHPDIFCLILRRSTKLKLINLIKPQLLPNFSHRTTLAHWNWSSIVLWNHSRLSSFFICHFIRLIWLKPRKQFIAFTIKIVVLIIVANSDDHTVRFREHLNKSNYIRLLSCPLYNLLRNLPEEEGEGDISIFDRQKSASI